MQSIGIPSLTLTDRTRHVLPETIAKNEELKERYCEAFKKTAELYNELKEAGVCEELLAYVLLSGNTLDIVTTINGRELLLFMKLRSCTRAQWEIRDFAIDMLKKLREADNTVFKFYGPSCFVNKCTEGPMTCGRAAEMKEFFNFLEKCWCNNNLATWVFNDLKAQAVVMTVEELRAAHKILERAMKKATDPMTRKRIQTTDDGLRYGGFVIEEYNICKNYINHKVSGKADAVKIANDAVAFAKLAGEREKFWAKSMKEASPLGESLRGLSARQNLCTGQISKIEHDLLSVVVDAMEYLRKNDPAEFAGNRDRAAIKSHKPAVGV
jgi:hypothetical protein